MAIRFVDQVAVRRLASMSAVIEELRQCLKKADNGSFILPQRHVFAGGAGLVMPAFHVPTQTTVCKVLAIDLARVPAIVGSVTIADARNGEVLVADAAAVTALRTGAIVGVATDLLADAAATRLLLFGAGAQAADQVRGVAAVRRLESLCVVDPNRERVDALLSLVSTEYPHMSLTAGSRPSSAFFDVDVICCATTATQPLFEIDVLPDRVHVNAIGAFTPTMRELPESLLSRAEPLVVDDPEACLTEAGDIIDATKSGAINESALLSLSSALMTPPRTGSYSVFKSVGIAIQDWAVMNVLRKLILMSPLDKEAVD